MVDFGGGSSSGCFSSLYGGGYGARTEEEGKAPGARLPWSCFLLCPRFWVWSRQKQPHGAVPGVRARDLAVRRGIRSFPFPSGARDELSVFGYVRTDLAFRQIEVDHDVATSQTKLLMSSTVNVKLRNLKCFVDQIVYLIYDLFSPLD